MQKSRIRKYISIMSRNNYWLACGLFCLLLAACSEEDGDGKDLDKPLIESGDSAGISDRRRNSFLVYFYG